MALPLDPPASYPRSVRHSPDARANPRTVTRLGPLSPLFGFAQFDFPGTLPLADGRYLAKREAEAGESVLVVQTIAAPPRPSRRRRRPRDADAAASPPEVPLTRTMAIRAFEPFEEREAAAAWLAATAGSEAEVDAVLDAGLALVNDALHAHAVAAADPYVSGLAVERAVGVRLGYGSGEETAEGTFSEAREVDVWATGASRRRKRQDDLRPQERVAAVLRGRERLDACEPLLLRARADLDAGRRREAALQLQVGLAALLAELPGTLDDDDHRDDIAALAARREAIDAAAGLALEGDLDPEAEATVRGAIEIAERVLRRRRVLGGD